MDIIEICNNRRHDIIIGGYNNAEINIKNDKIHLFHYILGGKMYSTEAPIILCGHLHKYMTQQKNNSLYITLPTLSNINQQMPSALELDVSFSKGYISNAVIKHLYFGTQDFVLSESSFDLLKGRNINNDEIKNVESYKQNLATEKVLKKTNS